MTIKDHLKKAIDSVTGSAKDELAAHDEKSESDIEPDSHVAGSRAGGDDDGEYVGRMSPQFDSETEVSGAEARSEENRRSP